MMGSGFDLTLPGGASSTFRRRFDSGARALRVMIGPMPEDEELKTQSESGIVISLACRLLKKPQHPRL
jgi:hypothetical protein